MILSRFLMFLSIAMNVTECLVLFVILRTIVFVIGGLCCKTQGICECVGRGE